MHRCGTSFAAGTLQLLGASFGAADHLMPPGPDNLAGYWENRYIKELNDELLAHLGGAWDQPPVLDPGWEENPSLDAFRARASEILDDAFGSSTPRALIAWKDPRLSLLLPFWRTVTAITTTIVIVRDPREVASSLRVRNGIEAPQAAMLWLRYLFAATANDPTHLLLGYQSFFVDLRGTLGAIAAHLSLPAPSREIEASARGHLDGTLRHHVAESAPSVEANPLVALAAAVWSGGAVDLRIVPDILAEGIRRGWFRAPIDGEVLARARAKVVELQERIRRRRRQERAAQDAKRAAAQQHAQPKPASTPSVANRDKSGHE